jgi:hypothetical protein
MWCPTRNPITAIATLAPAIKLYQRSSGVKTRDDLADHAHRR